MAEEVCVVEDEGGAEADSDGAVDVLIGGNGGIDGSEGAVDIEGGFECILSGGENCKEIIGDGFDGEAPVIGDGGHGGGVHLANHGEVEYDAVLCGETGEAAHVENEDGDGFFEAAFDVLVDLYGAMGMIGAVGEEIGEKGVVGECVHTRVRFIAALLVLITVGQDVIHATYAADSTCEGRNVCGGSAAVWERKCPIKEVEIGWNLWKHAGCCRRFILLIWNST